MTISFEQFKEICEVYDPDVQGRSQISTSGEGGRIQRKRKKTEPEKRRTKAIGGGKTAPAKTYKDRKDIGQTNRKRAKSGREQQPTQERGSAKLTPKEAQRKAYLERKAKERGEKTKTADQLLAKKEKKPVSPNYKPQKASGLTRQERDKKRREGETYLRGIMKKQETDRYKKETGADPDKKGKMKIMGRVHQRMSS
tara:strand:+ start:42 stop:632 length:591 start_codon:yes stop_codon:yes gene_type:complete